MPNVFLTFAHRPDEFRALQGGYDALYAHGFTDEDIGAITAFFGLSNRMVNVTGMRPNDAFFAMARDI